MFHVLCEMAGTAGGTESGNLLSFFQNICVPVWGTSFRGQLHRTSFRGCESGHRKLHTRQMFWKKPSSRLPDSVAIRPGVLTHTCVPASSQKTLNKVIV